MKMLIATSDLRSLISSEPRRLAEAIPSLPVAFQRAGHEVSVVGPLVPEIAKSDALKLRPTGVQINVSLGHEKVNVTVLEARSSHGLQVFLFRHDEIFGQDEGASPGGEMGARAATLFSKLVVELARRLNPPPDVIHIHDWPGALAPVYIKAQHLPFASVLSVADPAKQGDFPVEDFGLLNLGWEYFRPTGVEFYGRVNFLKAGIVSANAVIAAGDLECAALQTPEYGGGLEAVFRENAARLHGIPGGLDEGLWNPAKDPFVPRRYQASNLSGKITSRNVLLAQIGLAKNPAGPVFLLDLAAGQEGAFIDQLAGQLDLLLAGDNRLLVLGKFAEGTPAAIAFEIAARKHPSKLALTRAPDDRLVHMALAGADFQVFFGRDLRCSETILRSQKYAVLPIAPARPGLKQLVEDYHPGAEGGTGLVFHVPGPAALFDVLAHRAPGLLEPPDRWETARQRAMIHAGKFTWARTAAQYEALYGRLVH